MLYRSGLNPKIQRNFEVFSPCDFIAEGERYLHGRFGKEFGA